MKPKKSSSIYCEAGVSLNMYIYLSFELTANKSLHRNFTTLRFVKSRELNRYIS